MDKRIDEIRNEEEFFVYLKPGFALSTPPQHCFGARDRAEIRNTMKEVYRCRCDECRQLSE